MSALQRMQNALRWLQRVHERDDYQSALSGNFHWMTQPETVADAAPVKPFLTGYDMDHLVTYLRLLDADEEGADWREVARIVLSLDVDKDPDAPNRSGKVISRERSG